ncbi:fumarylacetoacetate hydrolase family protein [Brevibacillus humidisoli]|uniref:fumarylacetoacetate hydrolase family protein n=1 Tax=Brevibacillus humidisoli TaxID=2895522 RepID=UPI001E38735E|nr:fumarylacetoacetate hydrolase family protein [Brevibacillus humidisoli]UFJ41393.1 fumarylacetoacetate hydrolase family protein [Brevibacillus humidisoli]
MKIVTFHTGSDWQLGVKTERGVLSTANTTVGDTDHPKLPQTVRQYLDGGEAAHRQLANYIQAAEKTGEDELFLQEASLHFGPCVPDPGKIICVGLNYRKHAEESNMPVPPYPVLFNKYINTLAGHGEEIFLPPDAKQVDYEAELAIVIGRQAKRVAREAALNYVAGYCNANDLSARDLQFRTNQWLLGKCCDGFSPIGPYLVTADEVGDPNQLEIKTFVNGELRQHSHTSDMIFHCDQIVSYLSHYMTLEPGDVILTGTPEGVIMGYPKEKQVWLKDGDEVTIEIEKLGKLTNRMREERL